MPQNYYRDSPRKELEFEPVLSPFSKNVMLPTFYVIALLNLTSFGMGFALAESGRTKESFEENVIDSSSKARKILYCAVMKPGLDIGYWAHKKGLGKLIFEETDKEE